MLNTFTPQIEQKLHEQTTPQGLLTVYRTIPYGVLLTLNHEVIIAEEDGFLYQEMMVHPALFTQRQPQKIVIIGNAFGILEEVLKPPVVKEVICITDNIELEAATVHYFPQYQAAKSDPRVTWQTENPATWLSQCEPNSIDLIIQSQVNDDLLQREQRALHGEGILVQPSPSSLLQLKSLQPVFQRMLNAGFHDTYTLHFPQPSYYSGWRTAIMSIKSTPFQRIPEKDIFNRPFNTRYYNFDTHKAALSVPEFLLKEAMNTTNLPI